MSKLLQLGISKADTVDQYKMSGTQRKSKYKAMWRVVVGIVAMTIVATYAFVFSFSTFGPWDDDGYFLQAYREFLSGHAAYNQIFSLYGPFTFYSAALVARFNANNVTHDAFRWALLPIWIATALIMSGIVWRWTGRFTPAVIAFLLIGFRLLGLALSVGHPQAWILLIVGVLLLIGIDWMYSPAKRWEAFWTGLLLTMILLFKVNIGIFISVGIAIAVSLSFQGRLRKFSCVLFFIGAALFGALILAKYSISSEKLFAVSYLLSLATTTIVAWERPAQRPVALTNLLWLAAGGSLCLFAGVGIVLLRGTTLHGLFNALVVYPILFATSYHQPFVGGGDSGSLLALSIGLTVAVVTVWTSYFAGPGAKSWLALFKLTAGATLLCVFARWPQYGLTGSLLFVALLLVDNSVLSQQQYARRLLLAFLCPLFSLQMFPIAGTQVMWAELLPIIAAGLLLADGANDIERNKDGMVLPRLARSAALWTAPVLVILLFFPFGKATLNRYERWHRGQSLNLPGAHWLRLPPAEAVRLTAPVSALRQNCRVVLMIPGLYSYAIWSGVPPMEDKRINSWPFMWPEEVQKNEMPRLREQHRGCILVNEGEYRFFKTIAVSPGNDEILAEIQRTMSPIFTFQDITLYSAAEAGAPRFVVDTQAPKTTP